MNFRRPLLLAILLLCALAGPAAHASDTGRQIGNFLSGPGTIIYGVIGVGLPLLTDHQQGKNHTLRALDSLGVSLLLSEGLKDLVKEKRPDSNEHDSFPSGHATGAFSIATMESAFHPKDAIYWYAGATAISVSRITLHRHTVGDVLAGAALGYGVSRWELSQHHGLLLTPWIQPENRTFGLRLSKRF